MSSLRCWRIVTGFWPIKKIELNPKLLVRCSFRGFPKYIHYINIYQFVLNFSFCIYHYRSPIMQKEMKTKIPLGKTLSTTKNVPKVKDISINPTSREGYYHMFGLAMTKLYLPIHHISIPNFNILTILHSILFGSHNWQSSVL